MAKGSTTIERCAACAGFVSASAEKIPAAGGGQKEKGGDGGGERTRSPSAAWTPTPLPDRRRRPRRLRLGRLADFERIDADRLGDVLELHCAEIADLEIEPLLHLPIGVLGKADRAGLGDAFEPGGDIDAVPHEIAVALLDDVAEMNADAEFDAPLRRHAGVALDEAGLHFDRAAHRVDDAAELDDCAVAGALDDATVMGGDGRVDEIAAQPPERAPACGPRRRRRAGCSRQYPRPGSPRVSGSRSLRPSGFRAG